MAQARDADLRLAELVAALSLATDLGMGQPMEHALRSSVLAVRLGEELGLGAREQADAYYLALLRFVGCTADAHVTASVFGDEVATSRWYATIDSGRPTEAMLGIVRHVGEGDPPLRRARKVATAFVRAPRMSAVSAAHCEVAQRLAARLGLGSDVQLALGQIYERWDGKGLPRKLKGEEIAVSIRVVQLAQDAETFHRLGGTEAAVAVVRQRAGGAYDPSMAERFCRSAPRLLDGLTEQPAWDAALAAEPDPRPRLSETQLDAALRAVADFADLKSPYLVGHSSAVAGLAAEAARRRRLPDADVLAVQRAGWVHDVGRVGVTSAIWGKVGPLTDGEWERVRLHPYYTERVLVRARALAHLGSLAALHHERLDGSGYHRGAPAAMQPMTARLLAAADVYQALTEPRPHRPAYSPDAGADELRREVRAGRLDGDATDAVLAAAGHRVRRTRRDWPAGLSGREVEVLRLLARGLSNRGMAGRLSLSESTVHHHIQHIYDKIGVASRAAATLFAMQHDLLGDAAPAEK